MKNVTISLDQEVARWARIAAAENEMSLSRFVGEVLRERMQHLVEYERCMRDYLAIQPSGGSGGRPLPGRDELHGRTSLR